MLSPVSSAELDDFVQRCIYSGLFTSPCLTFSACKTRCTSPPWSTTLHTPNESVESEIDTHKRRLTIRRLSFLSELPFRAHFAPRVGRSDTNTRWRALRNSEVKTKSRSSMSSVRHTLLSLTPSSRHYQDAYTTLMIMFGSTAILPPRTKRWAEAKVLADTINFKVRFTPWKTCRTMHICPQITKLYLYNNEHALALSHHNLHMRRFADFSRGWGIGEETFEYWSWMARQ